MRKPLFIAVTILFSALLLSGCGEEGTVLVSVGDGAVTVEDLQNTVKLMGDPEILQKATPEERGQLLDQAVQIEVLYQTALAEGIDELPEVRAQIEQTIRDIVIGNYLNITFANYGFSEDELYSYFQEHATEFVSPSQANVRHILVEDEARADAILAELRAGADFAELADTNSLDRMSGISGGRLPVIRPDNQVLPPNIIEAIFNAKVNEPFGPLESRRGWHVFIVDAFDTRRPLSFEEAKQQIILQLLAPEEDVRSFYEENRDEFDRPDAVSLRYILVTTRDEAEKMITRIEAGEDISALAGEISLDAATRANGGLIPQLFKGRPLPLFAGTEDAGLFEKKAFSLSPGELSDPFELSRGWAVIQVLAFTPGVVSTFEGSRAGAQARLLDIRGREREQDFYDSLEETLGVTRNEETIQSFLGGIQNE